MATNSLKRPGEELSRPARSIKAFSVQPAEHSGTMQYTNSMYNYANRVEVKVESVEARSNTFANTGRATFQNAANPPSKSISGPSGFTMEEQFCRQEIMEESLPVCATCRDRYRSRIKALSRHPDWAKLQEIVKSEKLKQMRAQVKGECLERGCFKTAPNIKTRGPKPGSSPMTWMTGTSSLQSPSAPSTSAPFWRGRKTLHGIDPKNESLRKDHRAASQCCKQRHKVI